MRWHSLSPNTSSIRGSIGRGWGHRRPQRYSWAVRATRGLLHTVAAFFTAPDPGRGGLAHMPAPGQRHRRPCMPPLSGLPPALSRCGTVGFPITTQRYTQEWHMHRATETDDLATQIGNLKWFHSIEFGQGIVSPGRVKANDLLKISDIYFSTPLSGKSVLDIGAWDGFHSVQALKRGAASVTALDRWQHWGNRACIDLVKKYVVPELSIIQCDAYDLSPEKVAPHDIVLFAGVLYHMRHPFLGLEKVASVTGELLIVETVIDAGDVTRPAMIMYPGRERNNDASNWWGPNHLCVEAMLRDLGFPHIQFTPTQHSRRGVFHAWRTRAPTPIDTLSVENRAWWKQMIPKWKR